MEVDNPELGVNETGPVRASVSDDNFSHSEYAIAFTYKDCIQSMQKKVEDQWLEFERKSYVYDYMPSCHGYCPLKNLIFDGASVRLHLETVAKLRGIPKEKAAKYVNKVIRILNIKESDTECNVMKCDILTQRLLNFGMSIIATPNKIILIAPTQNMDRDSKIIVWNAINYITSSCTVFLVTTCNSEIENLCDRMVILDETKQLYLKKRSVDNESEKNRYEYKLKIYFDDYPEPFPKVDICNLLPYIKIKRTYGKVYEYLVALDTHSPADLIEKLEEAEDILPSFTFTLTKYTIEDELKSIY